MEKRPVVPTSLKHALELCKNHARDTRNYSVERIAENMGVGDWVLRKWMHDCTMPLIKVRAFELACGASYVTRWMAMADDKLLVAIPMGRKPSQGEMLALQEAATAAMSELFSLYRRRAGASLERTTAAIQTIMEKFAWHKVNVTKSKQPELNFGETGEE